MFLAMASKARDEKKKKKSSWQTGFGAPPLFIWGHLYTQPAQSFLFLLYPSCLLGHKAQNRLFIPSILGCGDVHSPAKLLYFQVHYTSVGCVPSLAIKPLQFSLVFVRLLAFQ